MIVTTADYIVAPYEIGGVYSTSFSALNRLFIASEVSRYCTCHTRVMWEQFNLFWTCSEFALNLWWAWTTWLEDTLAVLNNHELFFEVRTKGLCMVFSLLMCPTVRRSPRYVVALQKNRCWYFSRDRRILFRFDWTAFWMTGTIPFILHLCTL